MSDRENGAGDGSAGRPAAGAAREQGFRETLRGLWPYLWPHDRADLRRRVYFGFLLLLAAKVITVAMPYGFMWSVDALTGEVRGSEAAALVMGAIFLTMLYGGMRIAMALLTQ